MSVPMRQRWPLRHGAASGGGGVHGRHRCRGGGSLELRGASFTMPPACVVRVSCEFLDCAPARVVVGMLAKLRVSNDKEGLQEDRRLPQT